MIKKNLYKWVYAFIIYELVFISTLFFILLSVHTSLELQ